MAGGTVLRERRGEQGGAMARSGGGNASGRWGAGVEPCSATSREPGVQRVGGKERGKEKGRREKREKKKKRKGKRGKEKRERERERDCRRDSRRRSATHAASFGRSTTCTRNERRWKQGGDAD